MRQEEVIDFLTNLQSANPAVVIYYFPEIMVDELHRLVKDMKARNEIADFSSPWKCHCENECWLKDKIEEYEYDYFGCLE